MFWDDGQHWVPFFVGGAGSNPLTTKGDLFGFAAIAARVPIGTNGQVLTVDSTQALGLKWAASMTPFTVVTATGAGVTPAVPAGMSACEIIMQAAGGGTGSSNATNAIGGAGSGEFMRRIIAVVSGNTYNFNVGAGAVNANGGNTTFDVFTTLGGLAATGTGPGSGGLGGGRGGGPGGARGSPGGVGTQGSSEGVDSIGGSGGGGSGTNSLNQPGGAGGPCEERAGAAGGLGSATPLPGGGAGASSRFGFGAVGGNASNPGASPAATAYGAGASGPGAGTQVGAAGANGILMYRFL